MIPSGENGIIGIILLTISFTFDIIIYEIIHGIFFAKYYKYKSEKYEIMPIEKLFMPYCHCKEILKINHYRIAAIMPPIVSRIVPAIISLVTGSFALLFFGIVFIGAGCGIYLYC